MKSELAIRREYLRCQALIRTLRAEDQRQLDQLSELRGIQQALGWALDDGAMAPLKACGLPPKRRKGLKNARVR